MQMPSFFPTAKMDMGIHLNLTRKQEHMITGIDQGSPADVGCLELGSVILALDSAPKKTMSDSEVRDISRHFEGSKMRVLLRLPGVKDNRQAVERVIYFNKNEGPVYRTPNFPV